MLKARPGLPAVLPALLAGEALGAGPHGWVTCGMEGGRRAPAGTGRDRAPAPGGRTALLKASPAPFPAIAPPRPTISSYFCFGNDSPVPAWKAACRPASPCSYIGVVPTCPALCSCCCSLPQSCQRGRSRSRKQYLKGNKAVWRGVYSQNIVSDQRSTIMMNTALYYLLYRKGPLRGLDLRQAEKNLKILEWFGLEGLQKWPTRPPPWQGHLLLDHVEIKRWKRRQCQLHIDKFLPYLYAYVWGHICDSVNFVAVFSYKSRENYVWSNLNQRQEDESSICKAGQRTWWKKMCALEVWHL